MAIPDSLTTSRNAPGGSVITALMKQTHHVKIWPPGGHLSDWEGLEGAKGNLDCQNVMEHAGYDGISKKQQECMQHWNELAMLRKSARRPLGWASQIGKCQGWLRTLEWWCWHHMWWLMVGNGWCNKHSMMQLKMSWNRHTSWVHRKSAWAVL